MPSLETPGHPQASPGQSPVESLFLSPGCWCTRFCCALQETISQSCVNSGSSMVGSRATSSQSTYAIPTPRAPVPVADHCQPIPPQRCSNTVLSLSLWGPWVLVCKVCLNPLSISSGNRIRNRVSKREFAPHTILLGLLFCPWMWGSSSQPLQKLEVIKQEMARVNVDILGIRELKWTGMGEFNSDDRYIYYCGQDSLRRNGVAIIVNKRVRNAVLGCNLKTDRIISVHLQGKPCNITVIQGYAPTSNAKEAEVEWVYEDL